MNRLGFIETLLWWLAFGCAVLLVPSWLNPKTVRLYEGTRETQGWGWQNVASWVGVLVLVALVVGRLHRPLVTGAAICAGIAALLFGGAAFEAARTWLDLTKEAANPRLFGLGRLNYELLPATGMDRIVVIAVVGAICALVLLGMWLQPGSEL